MIGMRNTGDGVDIYIDFASFRRKLDKVANEYPKTTEKHLRAIGNRLKKAVKENTPVGRTDEKYEIKWGKNAGKMRKRKVKMRNTWSGKTIGTSGANLEYQLRSKSKRYHLVERGHVKVFFGKRTRGFVQGRFFFAKTKAEFERSEAVEREIKKMFFEIQKRLEG